MMKRILCLLFFLFALASYSFAEDPNSDIQKDEVNVDLFTNTETSTPPENIPASGYIIDDFQSRVELNKDTTLLVTETIKTNYFVEKHGIFRIIPVIYSANGKTIHAKLDVISVTDEKNQPYIYNIDPFGQSVKIKIGDPNRTITGEHIYIVRYKIGKVLQRYNDHDEIYWNITGHEWDTTIDKSMAVVNSPFASIAKVDCFSGTFGSQEKMCEKKFQRNEASFLATAPIGDNKDFTVIIALDKNNNLVFPGPIEQLFELFIDNWGYIFALLPLLVMFLVWYAKGRDLAFLSGNVYYQPDDKTTTSVPLFAREHLPLVYSPINGLTPSEVGTIFDERVNIQDVIAEIIELGRLGFLKIVKIEKKGFLSTDNDFIFVKNNKDESKLTEYQKFLLEKIFIEKAEKKDLEKFLKYNLPPEVKGEVEKIVANISTLGNTTLLSDLKDHFYKYLEEYKGKLYKDMKERKLFDGEPQKTRTNWGCTSFLLITFSFISSIIFSALTLNGGPFLITFLIIIPIVILVNNMPRRTAWGHSLFRQITGLKYYINEGKWREEIAEKNLFLEEILPLAICLGIVDKLAKDMAALGVSPPSYFVGTNTALFYSDFNSFNNTARSNLISSPVSASTGRSSWSGHSSWSGGSGFSGGSSGGGFGGGGGGSW